VRPRPGFPREPASGGEDGVLDQLSFDELFGLEPAQEPERKQLTPAEVARRCGLSYAPSDEQARVVAAAGGRARGGGFF
jgi:DNA helicase-2/ATP-dependent DNA helicase PcrA